MDLVPDDDQVSSGRAAFHFPAQLANNSFLTRLDNEEARLVAGDEACPGFRAHGVGVPVGLGGGGNKAVCRQGGGCLGYVEGGFPGIQGARFAFKIDLKNPAENPGSNLGTFPGIFGDHCNGNIGQVFTLLIGITGKPGVGILDGSCSGTGFGMDPVIHAAKNTVGGAAFIGDDHVHAFLNSFDILRRDRQLADHLGFK